MAFPSYLPCRVHQCLSRGPTAENIWEMVVSLITGEIIMALVLQVPMTMSHPSAALNGNKTDQVMTCKKSLIVA